MPKIAKPFATHADSSPAYWQIGNLWQVMATGVQTDNAFTLLDQIVHTGGGGGPVTHTHTQEEGLYVISGKCTFNAGGHQGMSGAPGTFVAIPSNCEHSFTVDEPDTHVLNFYLPAGFEQLLIGIAHPATERKPPPQDLIGEMMAPPWLAEKLAEDYGQTSILGNPFIDKPDPAKMLTKATPGATLFPFTAHAQYLETWTTMGGCWTILADGAQTGGSYCLLEVKFHRGVVIAPRIQKDKDEMFYVLNGILNVQFNDHIVTATKGSFVYIPSGNVYSVYVDVDEVHCLNLHTASGYEELIRSLGKIGKELVAPDKNFQEKKIEPGVRQRLMGKLGLQEVKMTVG